MQTKKKKREKSKSLFLEQRVFWISDSERRTLELFFLFFLRNKFAFRAYKRLNVFHALTHSPRPPFVCACTSPTPSHHLHGRSSRFQVQTVLTQFSATDREGLKASDWPARCRLEPITRPDWPNATPLRPFGPG